MHGTLTDGRYYEGWGAGAHAKWVRLDGDTYVGTWLEDNYDYMFNFRLTQPRKMPRAKEKRKK